MALIVRLYNAIDGKSIIDVDNKGRLLVYPVLLT